MPNLDPKLARALGDIALKHSAEVLIADLLPSGWKLYNATATLLQLGAKRYAVTCAHVLAKHRKIWSEDRRPLFHIGRLKFEPLYQRVVEDENLDLAVIELSDFQAEQILKHEGTEKEFLVPIKWPPDPVTGADWVGLGGYPGEWREQKPDYRVDFKGYTIVATPVTSVTEFKISCQFARKNWIWIEREEGLADPIGLGGLSGGPALVWREGPVLHWELAGIITDHSCMFDLMFLCPAGLISGDGSIVSPPWARSEPRHRDDEATGDDCQ